MKPIQLNFICVALNHRSRLSGLTRPYIDDTPLTLAPQRARKKLLISEEEILRKNAGGVRGFLLQGWLGVQWGPYIQQSI